MYSEGGENDADYMRMVQDVRPLGSSVSLQALSNLVVAC